MTTQPEPTSRYTFKTRAIGDGRKWEDIAPLLDNCTMTARQAAQYAAHLAGDHRTAEARYNVTGSLQGHYKAGTQAAQDAHRAKLIS